MLLSTILLTMLSVLTVMASSEFMSLDHFCHRINAGQHSQLYFQALHMTPRASFRRLLVVESNKLYWLHKHKFVLDTTSQDWLSELIGSLFDKPPPTDGESLPPQLAQANLDRASLTSVHFNPNNRLMVLMSDPKRDGPHQHVNTTYLFVTYVESPKVHATISVNTEDIALPDHRFIERLAFFVEPNTAMIVFAYQMMDSFEEYYRLLKDGTLFSDEYFKERNLKYHWIEKTFDGRLNMRTSGDQPTRDAQLLRSLPFGYQDKDTLYLVDTEAGQVYKFALTEKGEFDQLEESLDFRDFFGCAEMHEPTDEDKTGGRATPTSAHTVFTVQSTFALVIIVCIVCVALFGGLLLGITVTYVIKRWSRHRQLTPPTRVASSPIKRPSRYKKTHRDNDDESRSQYIPRLLGFPVDDKPGKRTSPNRPSNTDRLAPIPVQHARRKTVTNSASTSEPTSSSRASKRTKTHGKDGHFRSSPKSPSDNSQRRRKPNHRGSKDVNGDTERGQQQQVRPIRMELHKVDHVARRDMATGRLTYKNADIPESTGFYVTTINGADGAKQAEMLKLKWTNP